MANSIALRVARVFEECVFRRFGSPSLIRHDRDPRFMSEVFQVFTEMGNIKLPASGERSVNTVMQSVRVGAEDPLQQDWDDIAEKLIFAINYSIDATRRETPFYLIHGWDAQSTLKAIFLSLQRSYG
ncbi:reverse transcriptase [Phytophthora megakarya]|uniref:Reverse transcriptase n=1 Tax=Phytophthora megakarya TaxID=4795 RepID=A0A225WD60_9STRA|nr:reverse transcriptase [Phytophthora megakarya]